ncbi:hypothetical protein BKA93DRAFT_837465 [Sparassis latifolia]
MPRTLHNKDIAPWGPAPTQTASSSAMSSSSSPSNSPTRARRVSARRGSVSASDPWGAYASLNNPARAMSSRLTIVRVPPPHEDDSTPSRRHRRHGSNASLSSTSSKGEPSRLSFAFASFTQPPSPGAGPSPGSQPPRPASPGSPRMAPTLTRRYSGSGVSAFSNQQKLSPDQLVELARQSCHPRPSTSAGTAPPTPAASAPAPVSFTPLPDDVFLPFVDRPAEVAQLIASPPSAKLFALLAQTFPSMNEPTSVYPDDPKHWSYRDLERWLIIVDRDEASDAEWVAKARACVLSHSELIWERIKGALGVPPELDVEPEHATHAEVFIEEARQRQFDSESALVLGSPEQSFITPFPSRRPVASDVEPDDLLPSIEMQPPSPPEDEVTIEPVLASSAPPPTSSHDLGFSLHEVREEDESEDARTPTSPEVHGLRISTSPTRALGAPVALSSSPSASPLALGPRDDAPYDAMRERGPGHPLFPSSFAQLALAPTLRPSQSARTMSVAYPALLATGGIRRADSVDGVPRAGLRALRNDWAQAWDPARHEFAVASSAGSVSASGRD